MKEFEPVEIKFKTYKGEVLEDMTWTIKKDGVRAHFDLVGMQVVSRRNKPLHNLDNVLQSLKDNWEGSGVTEIVAEIFVGSLEESVSAVRTHDGEQIHPSCVFRLGYTKRGVFMYDVQDELYAHGNVPQWNARTAELSLKKILEMGHEGIVLHDDLEDVFYKIKPTYTHDVPILEVIEGTGKNEGRMGAVLTPMGKVGTGFKDLQRAEIWAAREDFIGTQIEVEVMGLTPVKTDKHGKETGGKFRHPRFIRIRYDLPIITEA